jgi:hypothetical protein
MLKYQEEYHIIKLKKNEEKKKGNRAIKISPQLKDISNTVLYM